MERLQPYVAGVITALVGFTSSFTVVLAGLRAGGASEHQAGSGLLTVSILMGLVGIFLSVRTRMPISIAWSTPGAALLLATGAPRGGFPVSVAAFAICGVLIILTGVVAPLRRLVLAIPKSLANALLAGVLLQLCLVPIKTLADRPGLAIPIIATWLVLVRLAPRWAVPAAMLVAVVEIITTSHAGLAARSLAPSITLTTPHLTVQAVTLGISLFVVTMASQNVPGIAVLDSFGYQPPMRAALVQTGAATVVGAATGGLVVNLAAISAALCAGPDAGEDRSRRWVASMFAGVCYLVLGLSAGLLSAIVEVAPAGLVETVAGLALLGTLGSALATASTQDKVAAPGGHREPAVLTFLVTASGIAIAGVGSPFWGLVAGLAMIGVLHVRWPLRTRDTARDSS